MVSNVRDRNIDSSRREDSRKGQVDRCEVVNVRPHVAPYPDDKDFNTVDVQLIDRPRINGKPLHIKYVKLNSLQRYHGRFQGEPWNARIGDMIYVYWLAEREALVLGLCTSVEQEPVCRSQADAHHQEYVFKLCPWEEPKTNDDKNYIEFPDPKHPECYKWWPKTRDSLWIFDCLEGHNTPSCCGQACNSLDDHQSSTCFKNFSDISPTTIDLPRRFKFLHKCGSYWYYDNDGTIELASKLNAALKCHQTFYPSGRILLQNDVTGNFVDIKAADEVEIDAATIRLDGDVVITGSCTHGSCSCESEFASLDGKAGGQTLCGGTGVDEELTLCGTSDASKGCVKVDADLECTGDLQTQIKAAIKTYCDTLYAASGCSVTNGDSHDHSGGDGAQIDHGGLNGLSDDDHSQYVKLAGRSGGQTLCGGTQAGDDLELQSTSNASKGCIKLNCGSANVDPSLTYGADCPCYIETAGLQLAMGCAVNAPYAFWLQVRQAIGVIWPLVINPLGGRVGIGLSDPQAQLNVSADCLVSNADYPAYLLLSQLTGAKEWGFLSGAGDLVVRNVTDGVNVIHIYNSGGMSLGSSVVDPGANNLYVTGDVNCASVTDHTPGYNGDALAEMKNITNDAQGRISHKTLPAFARAKFTDPSTGQETEGRNIGNMVSILTKAVQQLTEKLEAAEKKIVELEARL